MAICLALAVGKPRGRHRRQPPAPASAADERLCSAPMGRAYGRSAVTAARDLAA